MYEKCEVLYIVLQSLYIVLQSLYIVLQSLYIVLQSLQTCVESGKHGKQTNQNDNNVFLITVGTFDEKNEKVCFNQFSLFVVGAGRFGGKRTSDQIRPTANPPSRSPDAFIAEKTSIDQVLCSTQNSVIYHNGSYFHIKNYVYSQIANP